MRPIYAGFAANVLLVLLKYLASANSESASVNAALLHSLADLTFSALILAGTLSLRLKPSLRYPFGYGRAIYVAGFAAVLVAATYLFYNAVDEGLRKLENPAIEVSSISLILIATSLSVNLLVLLDALVKSREKSHPALLATIAENAADVVGDSIALLALALGSPYVDAYGAFVVASVIAVSSASLGYKYVVSLIGISAPRDIVGRVIKIALSDPRVIDVNDVKSLMIEPNKYIVFLQVEVDPNTKVRELEEIRHYVEEIVKSTTEYVENVVIEFTTPKEPRQSFLSLLKEVVNLPKEV
ncbi:MAG: cation diffusion facilitator family transporter [Sulfolobales archaeon]|nr:cation diffusion facilitator family transporter [Sulfolobales archaeon]MDW8082895.1 cation diffusion facilitator family transporter [Sulfolobales archaeon]